MSNTRNLQREIETQPRIISINTAILHEVLRALKPFGDESLFAGPNHEFVTVKLADCDIARAAIGKLTATMRQADIEGSLSAWRIARSLDGTTE